MNPRSLWIGLPLGLVALAAGWLAWPRDDDRSPAIRGKRLAEELGCFACHGPEGLGGVADPRSPGGEIPDWRYTTAKLFVSSVDDLRSWILHGTTAAEQARGDGRHLSIAPMPAYADHLSGRQVDDLVAYILAVSGWRRSYGEDEYQGWQIATRLGCFGCHGPSGMGGVRDPSRAGGWMPPLVGDEFAATARSEELLRRWILVGRRGDLVPMPAYHDFLSDAELDRLVAYIKSLQSETRQPTKASEAKEVIGAVFVPGGPRYLG